MTTELAGATFAMNKKMRLLNKENELKAMDHLMTQLKEIAKRGLFDFEIEAGEPYNYSYWHDQEKYECNAIDITVLAKPNNNGEQFCNLLRNTLRSLSLSEAEAQEYRKVNEEYFICVFHNLRNSDRKILNFPYFRSGNRITLYKVSKHDVIRLRNQYCCDLNEFDSIILLSLPINHYVLKSETSFVLHDNLGAYGGFDYYEDSNFIDNGYPTYSRNEGKWLLYKEKGKYHTFYWNEGFNINNWPQESQEIKMSFLVNVSDIDIYFDDAVYHDDISKTKIRSTSWIISDDLPIQTFKFKALYSDDELMKLERIDIEPIPF